MHAYSNYIAGRDVAADDGRTFTAFNPTTGGVWGTFALAGPPEVDRAVKAASDAFRTGPWGKLSPTRRGRLLMTLGRLIAEPTPIASRRSRRSRTASCSPRCGRRRGSCRTGCTTSAGSPTRSRATVIPLERAEHPQLHAARAAGRRRRHHAVELADLPRDHVARARRSRPAIPIVLKPSEITLRVRLGARAAGGGGRLSAGRDQRRHRLARDGRSAGRSSAVAKISLHRQRRRGPRDRGARAGSGWSAACWNWAARARTSCSTTRIWTGGGRRARRAFSRRRGRPASPARAPMSTIHLRRLRRSARRARPADPHRRSAGGRRRRWGRSRPKTQLAEGRVDGRQRRGRGRAGALRRRARHSGGVPGRATSSSRPSCTS